MTLEPELYEVSCIWFIEQVCKCTQVCALQNRRHFLYNKP